MPATASVWYSMGFGWTDATLPSERHAQAGGNNSVVECDLAKVEVAGSNPVSRSIFESAGSPAPRLAAFTPPALRRWLRSGRSVISPGIELHVPLTSVHVINESLLAPSALDSGRIL